MSNQNRFLLPHSTTAATSSNNAGSSSSKNDTSASNSSNAINALTDASKLENSQDVDTDFDAYWSEEAKNPHRNKIRVGKQYQATVPPLLKSGEKDQRKLEDLETLSFCPKKSARVSDTELDHYFTIAKSLNLFASLVETRSLLGRDVTIADLNHIRHKEGLSLASVIQPPARQTVSQPTSTNSPSVSPLSTQQSANNQTTQSNITQQSPQKSPPATNCDRPSSSSSTSSREQACAVSNYALNQPLMKALSHFISLHHPCHHSQDCKKLIKDIPLEDDSTPTVSITAGNLRQGSSSSSSKEVKHARSRSSFKNAVKQEEAEKEANSDEHQSTSENIQSPSYEEWTREEVEQFSRAIDVCGKNFGTIKKDFLPSKSVKSIVEYYYIGSRDVSEGKRKNNQPVETVDGCSSPEKSQANNNGQGGQGGGSSSANGKSGASSNVSGSTSNPATTTSSSRTTNTNNDNNNPNKALSDSNEEVKQTSSKQNNAVLSKTSSSSPVKNIKVEAQDTNGVRSKTKNVDPRMSVYNFDEELKEDSPIRFDCPKPGTEVKPLKAKPIIPNASLDSEATNSNVGSLKFFMDGQLVLKLNACQDQQEGGEKCHWVQSGDKVINASKQKRYSKKNDKAPESIHQNGSKTNSVVSSYQDDDSSAKNDDLTGDEDSKESMNSFTNLPQQKSVINTSPNQKRLKLKGETPQQAQLPSPMNYNRMAVNNRMKERNDNLSQSPVMNPTVPWLQAAAALLNQNFGHLSTMLDNPTVDKFDHRSLNFNNSPNAPLSNAQTNVNNTVNMVSKPMDLSLEHSAPKSIQKSSSRSRSKSKNNS